MKSISFDQLKTMLKSMSNAIFKRMGVLEDKVSPPNKPIKHIYATDEKGNAKWTKAAEAIGQIDPIIITNTGDGNEPNYVCNFTAEELWDVDTNVIQQNTRVIDGDKQYAVRGVNKILEPLYGKVIQFTAELNAAYYDFEAPFASIVLTLMGSSRQMMKKDTQTLAKEIDTYKPFQRNDGIFILTNSGYGWNSYYLMGIKDAGPQKKASVVLNVVSTDYKSLTKNYTREENPIYHIDIDRVSVVQAIKDGDLSGVVLYYTDSHEAAVGKTAVLDHIETTDITQTSADVAFIMQSDENGKYARITLNSDELGTANVEWLQTDTIGNKKAGKGLKIVGDALTVDEGEYELIEKIIIGYELLTAQPEDWETNWTAYYKNTGTLIEPVYELITDETAPNWAEDIYYTYSTDDTNCVRNKTPDGKMYDFSSVLINFQLPTGASTPGANTEIYSADERKLLTTIWVAASDASSGTKRQRQEIKLEHGMWAAYYTTYEANAAQAYLRTHNTNMIGKMKAEYPNISQIALPRHANGAIMEIYGVWKNG